MKGLLRLVVIGGVVGIVASVYASPLASCKRLDFNNNSYLSYACPVGVVVSDCRPTESKYSCFSSIRDGDRFFVRQYLCKLGPYYTTNNGVWRQQGDDKLVCAEK